MTLVFPARCAVFLLLTVCVMWGGVAAAEDIARCRLPELGLRSDVGLGFPRNPDRLPTLGEVHMTVLFADFPDAPAAMTPEQAFALISPEAETFFTANSYGKLKLVLDPYLTWTRMSKPSGEFHFHRGADFVTHRTYLQEAIDLSPGADFTRAQGVVVIANPAVRAIDYGPAFTARRGYGVRAGGRELLNGATSGSDLTFWGWTWFGHEIGHTMSLVDLAGPTPENGRWNTFVGDFSLMGSPSGVGRDYLGWERWQLGWLEDEQVICQGDDDLDATLSPIERPNGVKIVVVPIAKTRAIVIESRHAEGYDESLPQSGLLVYLVNTGLTFNQGAIRIVPHSPGEEHYFSSPLTKGQTVEIEGVAVTALGGDRLHVARISPGSRTADRTQDPATASAPHW